MSIRTQEDIEFVSQGRDEASGKIPDLTIKSRGSNRFFLLFEIKEHYKLSRKQWNHYEEIAHAQPHRIKKAFAIVSPYTDISELPGKGTDCRIWKWTDVYEIIETFKEKHKISQFLLSELLSLLESKNMKPFKPFSSEKLSSLHNFSGVQKMYQPFSMTASPIFNDHQGMKFLHLANSAGQAQVMLIGLIRFGGHFQEGEAK